MGNPIGGSAGFLIGCAFNPNTSRMEVQVERLEKKIANGARFAQSQPVYDAARLREMKERTAHLGIPSCRAYYPWSASETASTSTTKCRGYDSGRGPAADAGEGKGRRGAGRSRNSAGNLSRRSGNLVGGFYIIPPFGKYDIAVELVKFIKGNTPRKGTAMNAAKMLAIGASRLYDDRLQHFKAKSRM